MKISKIKIKKVLPDKGLIGFASCVVNDCLYLGNIAVFTRLEDPSKIRLVFPVKELAGDNRISIFYPLTQELYYLLETEIANKFKEND
jgi:DNA-binding cell septation regulator SpoVG